MAPNNEHDILKDSIADHQQAIDRAKAELEKLDRIRVPDGIRFGSDGRRMFLCFNEGKQILYLDHGIWNVKEDYGHNRKQMYLTPCKREDLKPGDWAYCSDGDGSAFTSKDQYRLILSHTRNAYIAADDSVLSVTTGWENWWKVTE
jgi:hypothetical protein